jgi:hypothetical protein
MMALLERPPPAHRRSPLISPEYADVCSTDKKGNSQIFSREPLIRCVFATRQAGQSLCDRRDIVLDGCEILGVLPEQ